MPAKSSRAALLSKSTLVADAPAVLAPSTKLLAPPTSPRKTSRDSTHGACAQADGAAVVSKQITAAEIQKDCAATRRKGTLIKPPPRVTLSPEGSSANR